MATVSPLCPHCPPAHWHTVDTQKPTIYELQYCPSTTIRFPNLPHINWPEGLSLFSMVAIISLWSMAKSSFLMPKLSTRLNAFQILPVGCADQRTVEGRFQTMDARLTDVSLNSQWSGVGWALASDALWLLWRTINMCTGRGVPWP